MLLQQAINLVIIEVERRQSKTSQHTYRWHARELVKEFGLNTNLADLTLEKIQSWVDRIKDLFEPATIRHKISFLSRLYKAAKKNNCPIPSPLSELELPKVNNQRNPNLSISDETRIKRRMAPWLFSIVQFFLNSGLRRLELFRIKPEDVHLEVEKIVKLPNGELLTLYTGYVDIIDSKTGKGRVVPLNYECAQIAHTWKTSPARAGKEYLFWPDGKNRLNAGARFGRIFTKVCKACQLDLTVHCLRHIFATNALKAGASLEQISKVLGHSSVTQTERYGHADRELAWAAVRAVSKMKKAA